MIDRGLTAADSMREIIQLLCKKTSSSIKKDLAFYRVGRGLATSRIGTFTRFFRKVCDTPWYIKLVSVLIAREIRILAQRDREILNIPLGHYLSLSLPRKSRIKAMTHHYNYLRHNLDKDFLSRICQKPLALWEEDGNGVSYKIVLSVPLSHWQNREGDLSLIFQADSTCIFTLSFTICSGSVFNLPADHVMYIGLLQGIHGGMDLIRTSMKNCHNTSQQVLLIAVAEGMCLSMNISDMVCCSFRTQITTGQQNGLCNADSIYDKFWMDMGAKELGKDMFYLPIPIRHKPLKLIAQHHRRRAVKRRDYRDSVADQARATFSRLLIHEPNHTLKSVILRSDESTPLHSW